MLQPTSADSKPKTPSEVASVPPLVSASDAAFDPVVFEQLVQATCERWQRQLYLRDWNVRVKVVRQADMPSPDAIGYIFSVLERKDAQLFLLSPLDVHTLADRFYDHEESNYTLTIVHELLHLHFAPVTQRANEIEQIAEEQAINAISRCLVGGVAYP